MYAANEPNFLGAISYRTQQVESQFLMVYILTSGHVLWYTCLFFTLTDRVSTIHINNTRLGCHNPLRGLMGRRRRCRYTHQLAIRLLTIGVSSDGLVLRYFYNTYSTSYGALCYIRYPCAQRENNVRAALSWLLLVVDRTALLDTLL